MAIILNRLERLQKKTVSMNGDAFSLDSQSQGLIFEEVYPSKQAMFTVLIEEDSSLILEYTILRSLLHQTLSAGVHSEADSIRIVNEALALAKRLDEKYAKYINDLPTFRTAELHRHIKLYRQWLAMKMERPALILKYITLNALIEQRQAEGHDNEAEFRSLMQEAFDLATVLKQRLPRDAVIGESSPECNLDTQQAAYQLWLTEHIAPEQAEMPGAATFRMWTETINPYRLGVLRMRRFLIALIPIVNDFDRYASWILWSDAFVSPCLSYFSLVFFMPRLMTNLYTLGNHWIEHASMSAEEISLGASVRFNAQWERLWPNITNDVAWTLNGMMMCFVFVGAWRFMAVYFSLIMQLHDLSMTSIRVQSELNRLNALEQQYQQMQWFHPDNHLLSNYLQQLHQRIECDKNLLYLSWGNFFVLFVSACAALPSAAALSPMIPVVGAMASVLMTVVNFGGRSYLRAPTVSGLNELLTIDVPQLSTTGEIPPVPVNHDDDAALLRRANSSNDVLEGSPPFVSIDSSLRKSHSSSELLGSPNAISQSLSQTMFCPTPKRSKRQSSHGSNDFIIGEDIIPTDIDRSFSS